MDGILGLGHFCESHGPCIILSTQRCKEEPNQFPHNLSVLWCESCQSIDLDQSLVSRDTNSCYVTTRTPLQQDLAFLLKQAAVRSLSCEETSKEGGTMYFGDSERGHVLSHTFTLQDSLARGFHRKYSILMLMRDKIHLLNCWPILTKNIKQIAANLQSKAATVNNVEQAQCYQRAFRQAQGSPSNPTRSLSQLTGEPAVFAQLHMWFTWLLSVETVTERPSTAPDLPISSAPGHLRTLFNELGEDSFCTISYCIISGLKVEVDSDGGDILEHFCQLLPKNWELPKSGHVCKLRKVDERWVVEITGCLPPRPPTLLTVIIEAIKNENFPDDALQAHINSTILHWLNVARALSWTPVPHPKLLEKLGIRNWDWPLLAYWTTECRKEKPRDKTLS